MASAASLHFLAGLLPGILLAWPLIALARRRDWVSRQRPDRHAERSVPLAGGLALVIALMLPLFLFPADSPWRLWLLLPSVGAFAIGAWDDLREMRPLTKGGLTALLALLAPLSFGPTSAAQFLLLAASCWILLHAFNIVDNMDGVALGTGALSFAGLALISGHPLAWAAAGGTVGVLLWNLPPARLFLGDGGSLLLGMWSWGCGVGTGLWMREMGQGTEILALLWTLPLVDLVFVSTTRVLSGRRPWVGGRDHLTHRMARALGSPNWALTIWLLLHLILVAVAVIACRI